MGSPIFGNSRTELWLFERKRLIDCKLNFSTLGPLIRLSTLKVSTFISLGFGPVSEHVPFLKLEDFCHCAGLDAAVLEIRAPARELTSEK